MKNKLLLVVIGVLVILSLLITSCTTKTTSSPATTATTSKPATTASAKWWDKFGTPQYGSTITYGAASGVLNIDPTTGYHGAYDIYTETLWTFDWTLDRKTWSFSTMYCPDEYWTGLLAKTWQMKDPTTLEVKLREGVKWQNKPPTNGREFVADDVVFHYDRHLGIGSGFTKPSGYAAQLVPLIAKVTAIDKYTVEFKFKAPSIMAFTNIADIISRNLFEAPEQVQMEGVMKDWKNAVGTGPWIFSDYVADSTYTFSKNPDYWGKDPRYPQNQLPYASQYIVAIIPDVATRIAALRSGKVDILDEVSWQQAQSLAKSNTELLQSSRLGRLQSLNIAVTKAPWTDLNVRKALDMAIDRKGIAQGIYGGFSSGNPTGMAHPAIAKSVYNFSYDEWPQSLKNEYAFNPTKAKELLAQAGFPSGFKTTMQVPTTADMALLQAYKSAWKDIGIDIDIVTFEPAAFSALTAGKKIDNMYYDAMGHIGADAALVTIMGLVAFGDARNAGMVNDMEYEAALKEFNSATTMDQIKAAMRKADERVISQHWAIAACPPQTFDIWQPYLKGYSGELMSGGLNARAPWSKLWIDQAAKKALGANNYRIETYEERA